MAIRWQLFGDYLDVVRAQVSNHPMPRPRGWDLAVFLGGKASFLALAFGIPMIFHPWCVSRSVTGNCGRASELE